VSEFNRLENGSFVDYESAKSFQFDHVALTPSGWEDYTIDEDVASKMYVYIPLEGKVNSSGSYSKPLRAYVMEHYPSMSAYAVYPPFPKDKEQESFTIIIVGNKYNEQNFWYFVPHSYLQQTPSLTFLQERSMAFSLQIQSPHLHPQRHRRHHRPLLRRWKRAPDHRPPRLKVQCYRSPSTRQGDCGGRKGLSGRVE